MSNRGFITKQFDYVDPLTYVNAMFHINLPAMGTIPRIQEYYSTLFVKHHKPALNWFLNRLCSTQLSKSFSVSAPMCKNSCIDVCVWACASANRCWQAQQLFLITSTLIPPSIPPPLPLSPASHLGLSPTHVCRQTSCTLKDGFPSQLSTSTHHCTACCSSRMCAEEQATSSSFVMIFFIYSNWCSTKSGSDI